MNQFLEKMADILEVEATDLQPDTKFQRFANVGLFSTTVFFSAGTRRLQQKSNL